MNYLDKEFEDDYVDQSKLAPKYGYEIALRSMSPFELGVEKEMYILILTAESLKDQKIKERKDLRLL